MIEVLLILLAMVLLLLLQGFFSGSEIALVNADKLRLRHLASQGNKGAQLVTKMFQRPEVLLGTCYGKVFAVPAPVHLCA